MTVKNNEIMNMIERISEHYKQNIGNRYLRKAFNNLAMEGNAWPKIERLTEMSEYDRIQGFNFSELYDGIYYTAVLLKRLRNDVAPNLRALLGGFRPAGNEKILMDMSICNFTANLGILADMLNELYMKVIEADKEAHKGKAPFYTKRPELADLGRLLIQI